MNEILELLFKGCPSCEQKCSTLKAELDIIKLKFLKSALWCVILKGKIQKKSQLTVKKGDFAANIATLFKTFSFK